MIERRLAEYWETCAPVVQYYRDVRAHAASSSRPARIVDFEITEGFVETLPRLVEAVGEVDVVGQGVSGTYSFEGARL